MKWHHPDELPDGDMEVLAKYGNFPYANHVVVKYDNGFGGSTFRRCRQFFQMADGSELTNRQYSVGLISKKNYEEKTIGCLG